MEPRPQRPRPQTPPAGTPPNGGTQPAPQIGPDPTQIPQQQLHQGQDPAAFVAQPRMEYDYSPLDLQPPGQRRKRQVIAGIIGALVVVAIGAIIIAGWMAIRDDDTDVDPTPPTNDRVAALDSTATETTDNSTTENPDGTAAANDSATEPPTQTPPTPTAPAAEVYDEASIRASLPVVESMPGPFQEVGDLPQDLPAVTDALGGGPEIETLLSTNGWQAGMSRTYESTDPATTGSTRIVVSAHAFKDDASAQAMLPEFDGILQSFGWTSVPMDPLGDGSTMLTWADPTTGDTAVTVYVVDGQIVYRVVAYGPADYDSTENALYVVNQILGQ